MGKRTSKLNKNKNNAVISLYQIYWLKLHENISKNYILHLSEEIAVSFNLGLKKTLEYAANI